MQVVSNFGDFAEIHALDVPSRRVSSKLRARMCLYFASAIRTHYKTDVQSEIRVKLCALLKYTKMI